MSQKRLSSSQERTNLINDKIYIRNIPSQTLKPNFDIRAVSTKYGYMPILDQRAPVNEKINNYNNYSVEKVFNPGNAPGPVSGFLKNVNTESQLRNICFALQDCEQSNYIPSSKSDLYQTRLSYNSKPQNHELLFQNQEFESFNPNPQNMCTSFFNNQSRIEIKDMK